MAPRVANVKAHFNPDEVTFDGLPSYGWCHCETPCRVNSCNNGHFDVVCTIDCCVYGGVCGSGLREHPNLAIVRRDDGELGVQATGDIDKDVILGEYFGHLKLVRGDVENNGYMLAMSSPPQKKPSRRVIIDASHYGGITRLMNHSCASVARFQEVCNGPRVTVVAVSTRAIKKGEEVTVGYGRRLWFVCRCGEPDCCDREVHAEIELMNRAKATSIAAVTLRFGLTLPPLVFAVIFMYAEMNVWQDSE